jgi:exosome complex RNA-binding protein Rrp42 (RNase PH superfamily)
MASTTPQNLVITGLTSITTAFATTGVYLVDIKLTVPTIDEGSTANSSVVVTLTQNSTVIYTGPAGAMGARTTVNATAGDTLTIALSSANSVDTSMLNVIKATIAIG